MKLPKNDDAVTTPAVTLGVPVSPDPIPVKSPTKLETRDEESSGTIFPSGNYRYR